MGDLLVLWDVDGTLLNAGGVGGDLYEIVFLSMFGRRCGKLAPMAGRTDRAIILDTLEMAGILEPRRHVDLFIDGLRSHAPAMFQMAQREGRALPGAADAIKAVASARVGPATIGFAVPATALPASLTPISAASAPAVPAAAVPVTVGAASSISAGAAGTVAADAGTPISAGAGFPVEAGAGVPVTAATAGGIPAGVMPAASLSAPGRPASASVPASAFIAAATTPFGADGASPARQREVSAAPIRLSPYSRPRPVSGRVFQSVLTGNVRTLAHVKLSAVGLGHQLDLCIGAYGDDHEIRAELVHLARRRAADVHCRSASEFSGEATIVIGDTPLDIEAALAAGARAVGVATGGYPATALRAAGAHAVLTDLTNATAVLTALLG